MKVELQKVQIEALLQIVNSTQIKGGDAHVIVGIQESLGNALNQIEKE